MKTDVSGYIERVRSHRKLRHRAAAFLTALSVLVSSSVFWQLRSVGTAMEDSELCNIQEHTHTEECYEYRLVCGYDDAGGSGTAGSGTVDDPGMMTGSGTMSGSGTATGSGTAAADTSGTVPAVHQHTEECYEKVLICGLEEHEHTEDCMPDLTADTEKQEDWEATLPADMQGSVIEKIVQIARSQLGYRQSGTNFNYTDEREKRFYTRYGEWYGNPYGSWGPLFTYFCMYYAGVDRELIPYGSGVMAWQAELEKNGLLRDASDGKISAGDVILLDSDLDGTADSCAVVCGVKADGDKTLVQAVQGDVEGAVAETGYGLSDGHITGYVSLEGSDGAASFEQTTASGVTVTAEADKGTFPAGAEMTAADISREKAVETAEQSIGDGKVEDAVAVDITFRNSKGEEIEPAEGSSVRVKISLPESIDFDGGNEYSLLHVIDEDTVEKVENASVTAEGAEFEAESFSIYVLTRDSAVTEKSGIIMENGEAGEKVNSEENPYLICTGENLSVRYRGEYLDSGRFTVTGNDFGDGNNDHHIIRRERGPYNNDYIDTDESGRIRRAEFIGDKEGICRIVFLKDSTGPSDDDDNIADSLWVKVVNSEILVETRDKGYVEIGGLTMIDGSVGRNSENNPYMIYPGEELNVRYFGQYKDEGYFTVFDNNLGGDKHHINRRVDDFDAGDFIQAGFTGSIAGKCRLVFLKDKTGPWNDTNIASVLWVQVVEPIYVITNYGDKNNDTIKEYLGGYSWIHDKNGYIQNTRGKPYLLRVGDKLSVRSDVAGSIFELSDNSADGGQVYLKEVSGPAGYVTYEAMLPTPKDGDSDIPVRIDNKSGDDINDTMYVRIFPQSGLGFTHCDMEIADDGKYTLTELTDTGKIERVYRAYVTNINDDTKLYSDTEGKDLYKIMPREAYRKIGTPGQTQYEMTSAYYVERFPYVGDTSLLHLTEYPVYNQDGTPWIEGVSKGDPYFDTEPHEYHFDPNQVKSVDFNVQITLLPDVEIIYEKKTDGSYEKKETVDISKQPKQYLDNTRVHFEGQPLIDALNKCPLDNGMDFTYMPEGALVKLYANKELTGIDLKSGDYNFAIRNRAVPDEYCTRKFTDDTVADPEELFTNIQPTDNVRAYKVFDHDTLRYTDSINMAAVSAMFPRYNRDDYEFANLIDRLNGLGNSQPPPEGDITPEQLYAALLKYAKTSKAILPEAEDGKFHLDKGHYFFVKDSIMVTAANDDNGKVSFPYIAFTERDKGRTYTYYMREIIDPNDPDVDFDESEVTVTIRIDNNMGITVEYNGVKDATPTFKNDHIFMLPNTGGPGIVPYIVFGTAMTAGSVLMFVKKRRREAG